MRELLDKPRTTVKVKFQGANIDVKKLTVKEVTDFQKRLKEIQAAKGDEDSQGPAIQRDLIRTAVVGAEDMTDEELDSFPMDDIGRLAETILRYAGVGTEKEKS